MRPDDFAYDLPEELIAQEPATPRDAARLLVLPRSGGDPVHAVFRDLSRYLRPGDCLVLNDSRVVPARLLGRRTGGGRAEVLLLARLDGGRWRALLRPAARLGPGRQVLCGADGDGTPLLAVRVHRRLEDGEAEVELVPLGRQGAAADPEVLVRRLGRLPLPPYIRRELPDPERYQTVYARVEGSIAAPTAGLHFTEELLRELAGRGVRLARVTLHVGPGTFRPVRAERVEDHRLPPEPYEIPPETAAAVAATRAAGGRVIAVGTTVVRALETAAAPAGPGEAALVAAGSGWTDLFIYPGYRFRVVDGLITNFHLPRSSLLMLVCAFAGRERVLAAYAEAVRRRYRFYSLGDAMLIV